MKVGIRFEIKDLKTKPYIDLSDYNGAFETCIWDSTDDYCITYLCIGDQMLSNSSSKQYFKIRYDAVSFFEKNYSNWKLAYKDILLNAVNEVKYSLYDTNNDNIPELIVKVGNSSANGFAPMPVYYFYTFKEGKIIDNFSIGKFMNPGTGFAIDLTFVDFDDYSLIDNYKVINNQENEAENKVENKAENKVESNNINNTVNTQKNDGNLVAGNASEKVEQKPNLVIPIVITVVAAVVVLLIILVVLKGKKQEKD